MWYWCCFLPCGVPSYGELQEATMTFEQTYPVVLIRDETVYSATNYGQAVFYASEGERVSKCSKIAEVYRWGYNESLFKDLIAVQQQIRDYQENIRLERCGGHRAQYLK